MPTSSIPRSPFAAAFMAAALTAVNAGAATTSYWLTDSQAEFLAGHVLGTAIRPDGTVVLGPTLERLASPEAGYVWQAAMGPDGEIYFVAGMPGKLYVLEGGNPELLLETESCDLPALAVTPEGEVFVGTAPGGEVLKVGRDGASEVFFETGETCVWCMTYSSSLGLVVGTGDAAKVFRVDADGRGDVLYDSSDLSISALAASGDRLLAGTSGKGLVVDITPGRDLGVLFDSPFDEISGIAIDSEGGVFLSSTTISPEQVFDQLEELGSSLGEGSVFRVSPAGSVIELWHCAESPLMCLGPGEGMSVLVGMGSHGLVYSIGPRGDRTLIADLENEEQILSFAAADQGLLLTTAGNASVYRMPSWRGLRGSYESDILSARSSATWGEIRWASDGPPGSGVRMWARSGNTGEPDETWSQWLEIKGDNEGSIPAPPAMFLQWKAELMRSRGDGPALRAVEVAYLRMNMAPKLRSVTVFSPGEGSVDYGGDHLDGELRQVLPGGIEVTYSLERGQRSTPGVLPQMVGGVRTAAWDAVDPDGDALSFDLWLKAEDEKRWHRVEDRIDRRVHTWDTQSVPDGTYRIKVVATDRPGNPEALAIADSMMSDPFIVDNAAPEIRQLTVLRKNGGIVIEGAAEDALNPIARVECALDYGEWRPAFAGDGMFDSLSETFRLELECAEDREHTVAARAIDRAGNLSVERAVLR